MPCLNQYFKLTNFNFVFSFRDNNREYQNQLRTQRSTKHNAGVYMDTTTEELVPPRIVKGTTAYAALSRKDKDLYEYESDDEI